MVQGSLGQTELHGANSPGKHIHQPPSGQRIEGLVVMPELPFQTACLQSGSLGYRKLPYTKSGPVNLELVWSAALHHIGLRSFAASPI